MSEVGINEKIRMVEKVEEFKPQLQVPSLGYVRVLISGDVRLREAWLPELLSFLVAVRAKRWRRELALGENALEISAA